MLLDKQRCQLWVSGGLCLINLTNGIGEQTQPELYNMAILHNKSSPNVWQSDTVAIFVQKYINTLKFHQPSVHKSFAQCGQGAINSVQSSLTALHYIIKS